MEDAIDTDRIISLMEKLSVDYVDFRVSSGQGSLVRVKDTEVEASSSEAFGMSARVLNKGSWGFASSNSRSIKTAETILQKAERLSRLGSGKDRLSQERFSSKTIRVSSKARIMPSEVDISDKASTCLKLDKAMKFGKVSNTAVMLSDAESRKIFLNSEGARIEQSAVSLYLALSAIARSNGMMQTGYERIGERGGYEVPQENWRPCHFRL